MEFTKTIVAGQLLIHDSLKKRTEIFAMNDKYIFEPLQFYADFDEAEMLKRATDFYQQIRQRRTVRDFSDKPVPREIIDQCILAAGTAPNGANQQPWHFAVVASQEIKTKIREAAEEEER